MFMASTFWKCRGSVELAFAKAEEAPEGVTEASPRTERGSATLGACPAARALWKTSIGRDVRFVTSDSLAVGDADTRLALFGLRLTRPQLPREIGNFVRQFPGEIDDATIDGQSMPTRMRPDASTAALFESSFSLSAIAGVSSSRSSILKATKHASTSSGVRSGEERRHQRESPGGGAEASCCHNGSLQSSHWLRSIR